jgi:hypothetical protein
MTNRAESSSWESSANLDPNPSVPCRGETSVTCKLTFPRVPLVVALLVALATSPALAQNPKKGGGGGGGGTTAGPKFSYVRLPSINATKINNHGDVVLAFAEIGFAGANGELTVVDMQQLLASQGHLTGYTDPSVSILNLNNSNQVAGVIQYSTPASPFSAEAAFFYDIVSAEFRVLDRTTSSIDRLALNDWGVVAGVAINPDNPETGRQVYTWNSDNKHTWLGTSMLDGYGESAFSINKRDEICGSKIYPWRYSPGEGFKRITSSLKSKEGESRDINEAGQVIGAFGTDYDKIAFRQNLDGTILTVSLPKSGKSSARAINTHGDFVGHGDLNANRAWIPFLYTDKTGVVNLMASVVGLPEELSDPSLWRFFEVVDINDQGHIVGSFQVDDRHTFMLTPLTQ